MKRLLLVCFAVTTMSGCAGVDKLALRPQPDKQPENQTSTATSSDQDQSAPEFFTPPALPPMSLPEPLSDGEVKKLRMARRAKMHGKPLRLEKTKVNGIPLYKAIIDLSDPQTYLVIGLANNAREANSATCSNGDEAFDSFVKRYRAALLVNGTFFSKDDQKRVMGNMITEGRMCKYSQWEDYGTTLGIKKNNELEMMTCRNEGKPNWSDYWFSLTCGPRLLRAGHVELDPEGEGFSDSHVLGVGPRTAIGFNRKKKQLIYAAFLYGLDLKREAELMKALGCDEAMNLDGGASRAVAYNDTILMKAGRPLTNVLVVFDSKHPAPRSVVQSWEDFQD